MKSIPPHPKTPNIETVFENSAKPSRVKITPREVIRLWVVIGPTANCPTANCPSSVLFFGFISFEILPKIDQLTE